MSSSRFRPSRLASTLFLLSLLAGTASSLLAQQAAFQHRVRVGFTTFSSPRSLAEGGSTFESVVEYLAWLSARSGDPSASPFAEPVDFSISSGNYYQILTWLRDGELDAAVVSPFTAFLLARSGTAVALVELSEGGEARGHRPQVGAWRGSEQLDDPVVQLDTFIDGLLELAEDPLLHLAPRAFVLLDSARYAPLVRFRERYSVQMVTHLSTSGFVFPLLYVEERLGRRTDLSRDTERRFWDLFMETVSFTFHHQDDCPTTPEGRTSIVFSYDARPRPGCRTGWESYAVTPDGSATGEVVIPNDVLVLRRSVARMLLGEEVLQASSDRDACPGAVSDPGWIPDAVTQAAIFSGDGSYTSVRPVDAETHGAFCLRVGSLLAADSPHPELGRRTRAWFDEGDFGFTIDEVVGFLRQDQANSGDPHLALVLPGGGVKALYQARLLDELYWNRCDLRNHGVPHAESCPDEAIHATADPLEVQDVIGTSGGAMVGFLAALSRGAGGPPLFEAVRTASLEKVFPFMDLLRWVSVFLLVIVLVGFISLSRVLRLGAFRDVQDAEPRRARVALPILLFLVGLLTALVIRRTGGEHLEVVRTTEGVLFALVVVGAHFLLTTTRVREDGLYGRLSQEVEDSSHLVGAFTLGAFLLGTAWLIWDPAIWWIPTWVVGAAAAVCALLGFLYAQQSGFVQAIEEHGSQVRQALAPHVKVLAVFAAVIVTFWTTAIADVAGPGPLRAPVMGAAGGVAAVTMIGYVVHSGAFGLVFKRVREYAGALALVIVYVTSVYVALGVIRLFDVFSFLEITMRFWLFLLGAGVLAALGVLFLGSRTAERSVVGLREAIRSLGARDRRAVLMSSPGSRLVGMTGLGLLTWVVVVAPAVYSNEYSAQVFCGVVAGVLDIDRTTRCDAAEEELWNGFGDRPAGLSANLIVTGALLQDAREAGGDAAFPEGDVYFCFSGPLGCRPSAGSDTVRWRPVDEPSLDMVLHAAYASGAPFPIFPAHNTPLPGGGSAPLVDGGYAHNIPLGAARQSGARQILLLRSAPAESLGGASPMRMLFSPLVHHGGRIFPFLFARAQELDRLLGRGLVVASLTPSPFQDGTPFPFLADFRESTVEKLSAHAEHDVLLNRRIGRVESWGVPPLAMPISPGPAPVSPARSADMQ